MVRILVAVFGGVAIFCSSWALSAAEPAVDFERDIRPIFAGRCFECHDGRKSKGTLRLDRRADALRGGESGEPAIVPGQAERSALIQRVESRDEAEQMPPEGPRLSEHQLRLLRAWIDAGADWPQSTAAHDPTRHWAFQPPRKPEIPAVAGDTWSRNEIDRFVLARLKQEGLSPSPPADRVTLIRRLSLDLTGLPPTREEVDLFLGDESEAAVRTLAARLLESPHYGERWGRHWLDAARYADSDGYEKDKPRFVWSYRDWVIRALNEDLPYDQFVIQQIAGDLLPNAGQDQHVATGFLRNSMLNEEGGVDPEQFRMEAMFDRMDAIGKSILGLTIQCAQCHNHKFDPLTQDEYYRLFAFLNNDFEANVAVYTPEEQQRRAELFRQIQEIEAELKQTHPDWEARMADWEQRVQGDQPNWTVVMPFTEDLTTGGGQKYLPQEDGSLLAQSYAPTQHVATFRVKTDIQKVTAFRLELLNDPNLPLGGPGRSIYGTAALSEFRVTVAPAGAPQKAVDVKLSGATADLNLPEKELDKIFDDKSGKRRVTGPISYAVDGNDLTAWGTDAGPGRRNQPRKAVFVAEQPVEISESAIFTFHLAQEHGGWNSDDNQNHNLGRFRLSITTASPVSADPTPAPIREVLAIPREQRTPAQINAVFRYWRTTVSDWTAANERIEKLWQEHPPGASQLVLQSRATPRMTSVLRRGDFLKPTHEVTGGTPAFLHPLPSSAESSSAESPSAVQPGRLQFARWLVARESPTTARAIINRVWQAYFGTGLVTSSEDLGTQSEPPTHPELLDWLAVEFMDHAWSLKWLHQQIVLSATYQQSSRVTPELQTRDPDNRLLARGARFRVEAEVVRDIGLAASGLLNHQVGGPSVYPPLPEFMVNPPASYGPKTWYESKGPDRYRRAVYTFRYRSIPYPMLQAFDAPNGDFSCVRRARSNTPLQALTTLNEPIFQECAQALGLRTVREGGSNDRERIEYAFRRCLGRIPDDGERAVLLDLLETQKRHFAGQEAAAKDLISRCTVHDGPAALPELPSEASIGDVAAWTVVARVLLNLDETITKE